MLIDVKATGRAWGDKRDPIERKVKIEGVDCMVKVTDFWDAPTEAGQSGQYYRATWLEPIRMRDDRFPHRREG